MASSRKKSHVTSCTPDPAEQVGREPPRTEGFTEITPTACAALLVLTYITKESYPLVRAHTGSILADSSIVAEARRYHGFCNFCVNK